MDLVGYECRGDVAWLTINRPAQRNALSAEAVRQLRTALERARVDAEVRIIVLTGSGDKHFSAGGDLGDHALDLRQHVEEPGESQRSAEGGAIRTTHLR